MSRIEFWIDHEIDVDINKLRQNSLSVKGKSYHNPYRGIEIFGNLDSIPSNRNQDLTIKLAGFSIKKSCLQFQSGFSIPFGQNIYHPPFIWKECSPSDLLINLTYMTNAFYRIFSSLANQNIIAANNIDDLLDEACLRLSQIYRVHNGFIMKHVSNTLNMYLVSNVIENLVGRKIYKCESQETVLVNRSLEQTLNSIDAYTSTSVIQQMSLALGRGVTFSESFLVGNKISEYTNKMVVEERTNLYIDTPLAIDHREHLIKRIQSAESQGASISMCAILDDTSETVFDLLWIQQLLKQSKHFRVNLLLNRAQVSINFSSLMLTKVLANKHFSGLAEKINTQLFVFETLCPLISFQTNLLNQDAWKVIDNSDFVYVKGLNFFETCQIKSKDTYHAFVVYGNVSRLYTGLKNFDAVFSFIPKDQEGYIHDQDNSKIVTLSDVFT
ncbi:hypothetical protein Lepto7376_2083 [[Leptolyngbya] sp. PCC 7376]|uniref:hypothetical protein n=1 Tax=[Leptolyngbya] sp. PCC 7376 TaxID=111781 RepID=UPI00029EFD90|nr:hypothetical protein [[Leptolyngbya] sp. PCC 7376]AFY38381.1 hypothetical protein Lepto7376_2083 [[Leptolyngbya] sp. PCC 7376]